MYGAPSPRERKLKAGGAVKNEDGVLVLDIRTCTSSAGRCNSRYGTTADEVLGGSSHRTTLTVTVRDLMNRPGRLTRDPSGAARTAGSTADDSVRRKYVHSMYCVCRCGNVCRGCSEEGWRLSGGRPPVYTDGHYIQSQRRRAGQTQDGLGYVRAMAGLG